MKLNSIRKLWMMNYCLCWEFSRPTEPRILHVDAGRLFGKFHGFGIVVQSLFRFLLHFLSFSFHKIGVFRCQFFLHLYIDLRPVFSFNISVLNIHSSEILDRSHKTESNFSSAISSLNLFLYKMHFFFFTLTICIYYGNYFAYAQDLLAFDSNDDALDATYDNDFWNLTSPTTSADTDEDLFLVDSSACASSLNPLGRRAGESCTDQQTAEKKRPFVEIRPLGQTKDAPLLPLRINPDICAPDYVGRSRLLVFCDSGVEIDRHLTEIPGVFDLINATPCMYSTEWSLLVKNVYIVLIYVQLIFGTAVGNHVGYGAARMWNFI